ncbi:hypothetical protein CLOM_g3971 [Closterium sp. NIES-68]|nr:hypothetical protein CLOM_g3971 [Closterium sp. NIES-68]GJP78106.1 hypothetical protein CLOP_g8432 [Closterium sp. NIES-67]GJP83196.1 hypothetical protein CLOP_g13384 [Closterium sp. NIES-67]
MLSYKLMLREWSRRTQPNALWERSCAWWIWLEGMDRALPFHVILRTSIDTRYSERASETNNMGQQLRDGANINKSLLALSNCINALCQQQKRGVGYVPYRNSKLTRLLKDGLSGNSRTTMVATICPAADQYHHIINTLKYADRAKEIKTRLRVSLACAALSFHAQVG